MFWRKRSKPARWGSKSAAAAEPKKPILQQSFRLALIRGVVHIVPIAISIALITVNLVGVYIGPEVGNQTWSTVYSLAFLQFAAKLQEVLVDASLTAVVFQILRHHLLHGGGLPFALLGSGFTFSKLDFLWSRSVFLGLPTRSALAQRLLIVICITVMGLVVATIGPSSAVLMLLRQTDQTIWTPNFWLQGGLDDLWPTNLTLSHIGGTSTMDSQNNLSCTDPHSYMYEGCISMAYNKIYPVLHASPSMFHRQWSFISRENTFQRQLKITEGNGWPGIGETWALAPHSATTFVQDQLWWDSTWDKIGDPYEINGRVSNVSSNSSAARTVCLWQPVTLNTTQLAFPALADELYTYDQQKNIDVSSNLWTSDGKSFRNPDTIQTLWLEQMDALKLGTVTAALIVLSPLATPNSNNRSALACSVDARWVRSIDTQADGLFGIAITSSVLNTGPQPEKGTNFTGYGFLPVDGSWTRISATAAWIQALMPDISYIEQGSGIPRSITTLADLFRITPMAAEIAPLDENGYYLQPYLGFEWIISTLFADGIARTGYALQLEANQTYVSDSDGTSMSCTNDGACEYACKKSGSGMPGYAYICSSKPPGDDGSYTMMGYRGDLVNIYAWCASAGTDYLSIAITLVYVCIALPDLIYNVLRRRTSRAWESLVDMLALAHSSRPQPEALANTCAGVQESETKARNVRIVVVGSGRDASGSGEEDGGDDDGSLLDMEEEEVQMVFATAHEGRDRDTAFGVVESDVSYGKKD